MHIKSESICMQVDVLLFCFTMNQMILYINSIDIHLNRLKSFDLCGSCERKRMKKKNQLNVETYWSSLNVTNWFTIIQTTFSTLFVVNIWPFGACNVASYPWRINKFSEILSQQFHFFFCCSFIECIAFFLFSISKWQHRSCWLHRVSRNKNKTNAN